HLGSGAGLRTENWPAALACRASGRADSPGPSDGRSYLRGAHRRSTLARPENGPRGLASSGRLASEPGVSRNASFAAPPFRVRPASALSLPAACGSHGPWADRIARLAHEESALANSAADPHRLDCLAGSRRQFAVS